MKMRWIRTFSFGTLLAATFLGAALLARPARADTFSVFADLPVDFSLHLDNGAGTTENASASGLSGYKVGITLPIFVGLAYESYGGKFNSPNIVGQSFNYDVTMVDLFLNLPLPVLNIAVGLGQGTGKFSNGPANVSVKDANLSQWFASLGINVAPLVDVHLGYHSFSGKNEVTTPPGSPGLKVDGTMTSLGVKIGF
jgi:hypothetical protein